MAAALEQAREVELQRHFGRARVGGVRSLPWLLLRYWCLSGATPRRFASVGVGRRSELPEACVSLLLAPPGARYGPQRAAPAPQPARAGVY